MIHLSGQTLQPYAELLPYVSFVLIACTQLRKIVKAISDFATFALTSVGRVVKAYRKMVEEIRKEKHQRTPRVRGRKPRTPACRITPSNFEGRYRGKNAEGGE